MVRSEMVLGKNSGGLEKKMPTRNQILLCNSKVKSVKVILRKKILGPKYQKHISFTGI